MEQDFVTRRPNLRLFEKVTHITAPGLPAGMVTAFMQRGLNYSYEVNWGIEKCLWHMEEELCKLPVSGAIGFHPTQSADDNDQSSSTGPGVGLSDPSPSSVS